MPGLSIRIDRKDSQALLMIVVVAGQHDMLPAVIAQVRKEHWLFNEKAGIDDNFGEFRFFGCGRSCDRNCQNEEGLSHGRQYTSCSDVVVSC